VSQSLNHVIVTGELIERQTLRYTPGAIAVLDMKLQHEGVVEQAGSNRTISFEVAVMAMGDLALMWQRRHLGAEAESRGFFCSGSPSVTALGDPCKGHCCLFMNLLIRGVYHGIRRS